MKTYVSISGPKKAPRSHCLAFYKYDGSNLRFEWSKKRGFYKFGTRKRLFDETDEEYGRAIQLFHETFEDKIQKAILDIPEYAQVDNFIAFCEFYGPDSFSGKHNFDGPLELSLIDVAIHKKGFMLPEEFRDAFEGLKAAPVVYEGEFNSEFINDVREGKYDLFEGVVAKGLYQKGKKKTQPHHNIWMAKVKLKCGLTS